ncbi:hypothetical protein [Streptomyces sp. NPDC052015]|uniref:hypothetical protein n=1 Tax=Streptomyces sp. NPDC052015 TaxID=3154755 RepID=UPI00342745C5
MAAAATSILSLYGTPASADPRFEGTSGVSPSGRSGHTAEAPADTAANTDGSSTNVRAEGNPSLRYTWSSGPNLRGSNGPSPDADRQYGDQGHNSGFGYDGKYSHDADYGDDSDGGDGAGNSDDSDGGDGAGNSDDSDGGDGVGYGDDSDGGDGAGNSDDSDGGDGAGNSDDSSTPPTEPPTSSTSSIPAAAKAPTSPQTATSTTKSPTQPSSLAETGNEEEVLVASGLAALLVTSGVILYRRGRAASLR